MNFRQSISIISIVLATISIVWGLLATFLGSFLPRELYINFVARYVWEQPANIQIFLFIPFFGLVLGITAFKLKANKTLAVLGIILSLIAILLWLFIWLWTVGWSTA